MQQYSTIASAQNICISGCSLSNSIQCLSLNILTCDYPASIFLNINVNNFGIARSVSSTLAVFKCSYSSSVFAIFRWKILLMPYLLQYATNLGAFETSFAMLIPIFCAALLFKRKFRMFVSGTQTQITGNIYLYFI